MKVLLAAILLLSANSSSTVTIVSQGSARAHVVALTFDAGADRGYAARILQTLERNHIHATFGMTGRWAQANSDLVRRIARDHDAFINHTFDHRSFTGFSSHLAPLSRAKRIWEIDQTDRVLRRMTGHSTKPYFRPPYGDYDSATMSLVRQLGYRYMVMWTVDSLGWEHLPAAAILQRCLAHLQPGAIYLMHVGIQSQDALSLQPFITALQHRGYRFVTVPQLVTSR